MSMYWRWSCTGGGHEHVLEVVMSMYWRWYWRFVMGMYWRFVMGMYWRFVMGMYWRWSWACTGLGGGGGGAFAKPFFPHIHATTSPSANVTYQGRERAGKG